jgi:acyl-CoA thioester hydrolase
MQVIAAHGWPITRMLDEGHAILIRRHQIQYKQPALLNDDLVITTWISNVRRSTATRHYHIMRKSDDAMIAIVHSLGVWVDLTSGRPLRFPENFLENFTPNMVE